MTLMMLDDLEIELGKITLGPDDVLVVKSLRPIAEVAKIELAARVRRLLGNSVRVLVTDPTVEVAAEPASGPPKVAGNKPKGTLGLPLGKG